MFSNYYQIGESIELFNSQDKSLLSRWGLTGKCSKVYDPKLHSYEMVLSIGNLSKMEIPKSSKIKTLSLFQSFIVFQIYLFTSKSFTIEIAISDSTNAKRRLIFSTNNSDLAINQLHCRIPIFKFPIGCWVNFSVDILSFVSKCYKDLTFRSVDYISLSMSGKVRYIFAMRTPLIEINNKFVTDEEGNIIENNDLNTDNLNNEYAMNDNYTNENNDIDEKNNQEDYNFFPTARDVPTKYKLPKKENAININIDCNKVFSQIYIENENKQFLLSENEIINKTPIIIQDTANANKTDKFLKFKNTNFLKSQKMPKNKYILENNNIIIINNRNDYSKKYNLNNINFIKDSPNYLLKNNNPHNPVYKQENTFNKLGNLIISQSSNALNKKQTYNFGKNMAKNLINNDIYRFNEINNENKFRRVSKQNNELEKYDLFNKEEYNDLYKRGKGVIGQVKRHINTNKTNINNANKFSTKDLDEKINSELSTIHNINNENYVSMKTLELEQESLENNKNEDKINK